MSQRRQQPQHSTGHQTNAGQIEGDSIGLVCQQQVGNGRAVVSRVEFRRNILPAEAQNGCWADAIDAENSIFRQSVLRAVETAVVAGVVAGIGIVSDESIESGVSVRAGAGTVYFPLRQICE